MDAVQNVLTDANLLDHIFNCIGDSDPEVSARTLAHWGEGINHTIKRACEGSRDAAWTALYDAHFKRLLAVNDRMLHDSILADGAHPGYYVKRLAQVQREGATHKHRVTLSRMYETCNHEGKARYRHRLERVLARDDRLIRIESGHQRVSRVWWYEQKGNIQRPILLCDLTDEEKQVMRREQYWRGIVIHRRARRAWMQNLQHWEKMAYHAIDRVLREDALASLD